MVELFRRPWLIDQTGRTAMVDRSRDPIVETPTEARQAEPGPSVLAVLLVSVAATVLLLGGVWLAFFRT